MAELDRLQDEYARLTRTIEEQNRLRDTGSDDYDVDTFDRALSDRDRVARSITKAGGTPGKPAPTGTPPPGPTVAPTPAPDPTGSTVLELGRALDSVRDNPPHPGVRLVDNKVVGGTEKELKEQTEWRAEVERLEHELTAAQADEAWQQAGGPDGFTDADRQAIKQARETIDAVQKELDAVKAEIARNNAQLESAQSQLDGEKAQGGGPSAAGGAAIAVGARIQGELRKLYKREAEITKRLQAAQAALAKIVTTRVGAQLGRGDNRVDLPRDRVGAGAVQDAFLRRVYRRLGLPYPAPTGTATLKGLGGPQSSLPGGRGILIALAVLVLLALVAAGAFALSGGEGSGQEAAVPGGDLSVAPTPTPGAPDATPTPVPVAPGNATKLVIPYLCGDVTHSPLAGFPGSRSRFVLWIVVAGVNGPVATLVTVTVDAGGLAPNTAPVKNNVAAVPIPIDRFGSYPVRAISAKGPDGPLPVTFSPQTIVVGSAEGPVGGCKPPAEALSSNPRFYNQVAKGLWIGDEVVGGSSPGPTATPSPSGGPSATATPGPTGGAGEPDFAGFLGTLDEAHRSRDIATLFDTLDAATIRRYGAEQCRTYLGKVAGSLTGLRFLDATAEPWDYVTDGATTAVPDAWTLEIRATLGGSKKLTTMHVRDRGATITWFTDCGTPLN